MDRARRILRALCDYGRPLILEQFVRSSCIASTAIAIDALRAMEIDAYPLTVRTTVFNAPMLAKIDQMGRLPEGEEERKAWQEEAGAYALGIGVPHADGQPSIHLIAILPAEMLMLDMTLDQASRPQHGISLEPAYGPITQGFLFGAEPLTFSAAGDILVRYDALPAAQEFRAAPDWLLVERRAKLLAKVLVKIRMIERSRQ